MRRFRGDNTDEPGQDSFLDIVANLVGILIILVMVIGMRAKGALEETAMIDHPSPKQTVDVESSRREYQNLDSSVANVENQLSDLQGTMDARQQERDHLNLMVQTAKVDMAQRRENLDQAARKDLELKSKFRLVSAKLQELKNKKQSLELDSTKTIELEHLPTPLAKTVFGREQHFRLLNGKLTYVPLNELTDRLRDEVPKKLWKLKDVRQITETIGPVLGFHLKYTMKRRSITQNTKSGPAIRQFAELERFVMLPMSEDLGEPIDKALKENSQFRQVLATLNPKETVVTVWTYPDSYAEFRSLKTWLFDRGFTSAARPLPYGQPITGSPQGSRSAAQ